MTFFEGTYLLKKYPYCSEVRKWVPNYRVYLNNVVGVPRIDPRKPYYLSLKEALQEMKKHRKNSLDKVN